MYQNLNSKLVIVILVAECFVNCQSVAQETYENEDTVEEMEIDINGRDPPSRGHNADAIIALTLTDAERFSVSSRPPDYDFIQGVNDMVIELLLEITRPGFQFDNHWSRGRLGQYIVALSAACLNPKSFYGHDLSMILREQLRDNFAFFRNQRIALAWTVLAICIADLEPETIALDILSADPGTYKFGIDEAAMIVIALSCVGDNTYLSAQRAAEDFILNGTKPNGSFGNEFTTGLVVQALTRYSGSRPDVIKTFGKAREWLSKVMAGKVESVKLANQVLPALSLKSYVDIRNLKCTTQESSNSGAGVKARKPTHIHVELTVRDKIIGPAPLDKTWDATASKGDSMFVVMQKLEKEDKTFNFTSERFSIGEYITGFLGREADSSKNQYWAFLKYPNIYMPTGVSNTYPRDGVHYIFNATTWK